jgi:hypothetical protein
MSRAKAGWRLACAAVALVVAPANATAQPVAPQNPPLPDPMRVPPQPVQPPQPAPWPVLIWLPMLVVLAVAVKKHKQDREEEEVTPVEPDAPMSYEYKILRSASASFKDRAKLKAILEEEARAGWELYELLDCSRLRLRRSVTWRARDGELTQQDPYRTRVGASEGAIALRVILVALALMGVALALILLLVKK